MFIAYDKITGEIKYEIKTRTKDPESYLVESDALLELTERIKLNNKTFVDVKTKKIKIKLRNKNYK